MPLLQFVLGKLRKSNLGPALTRYYIMPHVKLHHFHQNDAALHNHPWNAFSIIFGKYLEHYADGSSRVRRFWNWLPARRFHRIELYTPVWTLFFTGRRINEKWQYGDKERPWKYGEKNWR